MSDLTSMVAAISPAWGRLLDRPVVRGRGVHLWDADGRRYFDGTSGIGVCATGHCHPRVVEAIRAQAEALIHLQGNIAVHEPMLRTIELLRSLLPASLDTFFFANTGAEAIEAAIKTARQATGRTNVITFEGGFHGRTIGAMSLTASKTIYRAGFQPLMPGVFHAPYAYCYRCPLVEANAEDYGFDRECRWELDKLEFVLRSQTAPEETAAILLEPILGEGGYVVPPPRFLAGLREICDRHGIMLVVDEVQTGFGRTGRMFAFEHSDVVPDIVVMSKSLTSGLPMSCVAHARSAAANTAPGSQGGTFGGNILACAAAEATLQVLIADRLADNAAARGAQLLSAMRSLADSDPTIGDVRGLGLMVGVEFVEPGGRTPNRARARQVQAGCIERGLLILTCGTDDNVIRWIPPLIVDEAQMSDAIAIFGEAVGAAGAG